MAATKTPRVSSKKSAAKNVGKKKPAKKLGGKTSPKRATPKPASSKKAVSKPVSSKQAVSKQAPKAASNKATPKAGTKQAPKAAGNKARTKPPAKPKAERNEPLPLDAMSELAQKRSIKKALTVVADGKTVVDAYMRDVDHPFKAELEAVRQIILGASPKISERIKWNAPSFYYKEDLGAFHPRSTEYAHLILLFPDGAGMQDDTGLLEGNHKDRREAKFHNMADVSAKKPALEALVQRWVALRDG